ncbi:hypothetical protein FOTG_19231 [Fusarium oxysporum f. sp. vasinfectum 25433]|uniref:Uncharacterized protein n=1 Tax=Fusarium oxysporum f. sp. vasinfectum 25433 TaxID=1089449 RepID=X0KFI3_FUSOX|nr:hypothetical protein FOTG_19231 [Fusarium oxysporum f. sp. vasinfectum 25433]
MSRSTPQRATLPSSAVLSCLQARTSLFSNQMALTCSVGFRLKMSFRTTQPGPCYRYRT